MEKPICRQGAVFNNLVDRSIYIAVEFFYNLILAQLATTLSLDILFF